MRSRLVTSIAACLLAVTAFGRQLPNIDKFGEKAPSPAKAAALAHKADKLKEKGLRMQGEARLGVPTFMWGSPALSNGNGRPKGPKATRDEETSAARVHLKNVAAYYDLDAADVDGAEIANTHDTGTGPIITKFRQKIGGIEIFREETNVVMDRNLGLVSVTGYISSKKTPSKGSFKRSASEAAADAIRDLTGVSISASALIADSSRDGYDFLSLPASSGVRLDQPVRLKKVYYHLEDSLEPAYYVEVNVTQFDDEASAVSLDAAPTRSDYYSYVVSANDGTVLFRNNLTANEKAVSTHSNLGGAGTPYTYRVWADPVTGIPYDTIEGNDVHPKVNPVPDGVQSPFLPPNDVTLSNFPFSMNDPWLPPGSTETVGNNADAYLDLVGTQTSPYDGYNPVATAPYGGTPSCANPPVGTATCGDFRAKITSTDAFQNTFNPANDPNTVTNRLAVTQQLFYNVNFLHDWYYDAGFDEASGNAQTDNFGRGGLGNDSIKAEAQDVTSTNNANMSTPADGQRPRMQMYIFTGNGLKFLDVNSPANIAGRQNIGTSSGSPLVFDLTGDVVKATFNPAPACTFTNTAALSGKIGLLVYDEAAARGASCFGTAFNAIISAGSTGIILVWQQATPNNIVNLNGSSGIPFAGVSWNASAGIRSELALNNTVNVHMKRDPAIRRDGSVDNTIVAHEWGHYISNRLISNSAGLGNNQGRSMGEGWGDFNAMMLTVRAEDINVPSNANWSGVYALATYATGGTGSNWSPNGDGAYYGIRRYPYSTDMTKSPATFKFIMNGVDPVVPGVPINGYFADGGANNSEVHAAGEVWSVMLWECYASLLRDTLGPNPRFTFQEAQDRMKSYFVAAFKMTPANPTYTEARDAMLAAAYATDFTDYAKFWAAFAKRGMGVGAVSPDRASTTHSGVVESFEVAPDAVVVSSSTTLDDSVANCDADGVLDAGEYGKLTVAIKNVGIAPLSSTTATIASTTPGVSFPNGTTINFPTSDPLSTVSASITVALAPGTAGVQQLDFQITLSDPAITGTRSGAASFRGNYDIVPASTATDDVEAATMATTPWSLDFDPAFGNVAPFSIKAVTPLSHNWFGPNGGAPSDNRLVSPVFTVNGGGSVTLQWDHTWSFENTFDGGVIEMSVNGGAWSDVGVTGGGTTNGYNGTLVAGGTNPLNGRPAWTGTQAVSQHVTIVRAIAPGSTVRFRFRTGADDNTAGSGWNIDNIAFSGVVETPFATLTADTGCVVPTSTTLTSSPNPSALGSPATLTAVVASAGGTPTGSVSFFDGANLLGTVALSAGSAQLTTSSLSSGLHSLSASYGGDTGHSVSSSASVAHTVSKIATTTAVGSNNNPSTPGASVTFTATVTATSGTPGGSVVFADGATTLATVNLVGGSASYTTSALTGGMHTINATYGGNGTYFGSNGSVAQNVNTGSTVQFSAANYWPLENGGNATLTVTRTGGDTTGAATVHFSTANGTATAGVRYTATNLTVNFAAGETTKTVDVPLIDTLNVEGKETFTATLSSPNAADLGAIATTLVTIMDDDAVNSDFNSIADGGRDLVWRNPTTGGTRAWLMSGTTILSAVNMSGFGAEWKLVGVADFNGDGHGDVLWRNNTDFSMVITYMSGTNFVGGTSTVETLADPNWQVVDVADMNGDLFPDIIWRNMQTFASNVWLMRDNVKLSVATLPTVNDANWSLMGSGDFNRDRKTDLVWRHSVTQQLAIWVMNGTTFTSAAFLPSVGAPWQLIGVGDMNGDKDADLIWQTTTTHQIAVWQMNQTAFGSAFFMNTAIDSATANDPAWKCVAPK